MSAGFIVIVRDTSEAPVSGDTVIVPVGNKLSLFVLTDTVKDSPASSSVGVTLTEIFSPSSDISDGFVMDANTGISFVLATVIVKPCDMVVSESLTCRVTVWIPTLSFVGVPLNT